ncbi:MAG TPA: hypothetical protein VMT22_00085 [Terriglobales bacterium]|nr:hypothetical protein [Terriglobales bacterium]
METVPNQTILVADAAAISLRVSDEPRRFFGLIGGGVFFGCVTGADLRLKGDVSDQTEKRNHQRERATEPPFHALNG